MPNGWRCWKVKWLVVVSLLFLLCGAAWWWIRQPRTADELYVTRCSACHTLSDMCQFPRDERVTIVDTMRELHGAAEVISDSEAGVIKEYLREGIVCP